MEIRVFTGHVHRDIVSSDGLQIIQNALSQTLVGDKWRFLEDGGYRLAKVEAGGQLETKFFKFDQVPRDFEVGERNFGILELQGRQILSSFWWWASFLLFSCCAFIYLIKKRSKHNFKIN